MVRLSKLEASLNLCAVLTIQQHRMREIARSVSYRYFEKIGQLQKEIQTNLCDLFPVTEQDDEEVVFTCKSKSEDEAAGTEIEDEIEFTVSVDEGLMVKVKYEQEVESNTTETETETSYIVTFFKMVEYSKVGNTTEMAFDWDMDLVVQTVPLSEFTMSGIQTDARGIVSRFDATSPDGVMTFTFTISRADFGGKMSANKMKIDFELKSFPWMMSDTYVALVCDIVSEQEIDIATDEDSMDESMDGEDMVEEPTSTKAKDVRISFAQAVDTIGVTPFGEYTWDETALVRKPVNGTTETNDTAVSRSVDETIAVVATKPVDPMNTSIAFSFVGDAAMSATDIYWDPEAGVNYASETVPGSTSFAFNANSMMTSSVLFLFASVGAFLAM